MAEVHGALGEAAHDVGALVVWALAEAILESRLLAAHARISSARTYAGLDRAGAESRLWHARLGTMRAGWPWGGR